MTTDEPSSTSNPYLTSLRKDGYVIIRSLLTPTELTTLRAAASNLTSLARAGKWPHIRTVGKQFPPWPSTPEGNGIWGVQHLLHPDLPLSQPEKDSFVRAYFSPKILKVVRQILEIPEDSREAAQEDPVMELFNLLVRPDDHPEGKGFQLRWHRDDIPWTASPPEEESGLNLDPVTKEKKPYLHTQYNLPLFDGDDSLILIPGSHLRARTQVEREAEPFADDLPGQIRVVLNAGDVAFYDNNILHRGVYDPAKERLTLHGSVGHSGGSKARARNVLQHKVGEYVERCDFGGLGGEEDEGRKTAEGMRRRLMAMGRENVDVGFSLSG